MRGASRLSILIPELLPLAEQLQAELLPLWLDLAPAGERAPDPAWAGGSWAGESWTGPPLPPGWRPPAPPLSLPPGRCELIVGAGERADIGAGLLSGADALVLDLDDAFSPRRGGLERAYANLHIFADAPLPLLARVRPLRHREGRVRLAGEAALAGPLDLLVCVHALRRREALIYLPKLDTPQEARLWARALECVERLLSLPPGAVRVCLQIETLPALFNAEQLVWALGERVYGLNAGRWDYVFSAVKHLGDRAGVRLPERAALGMDEPSMRAYARRIVQVCRRLGLEAVGGTAALDPAAPGALEGVRADKAREARQGFTSAWAALPALVAPVRSGLQVGRAELDEAPAAELLAGALRLPRAGGVSSEGVADALGVALSVLTAWLEGVGWVLRAGRIEDTATAELSRALLRHWHRAGLLDTERYLAARRAALRELRLPEHAPAAQLLDRLVLGDGEVPLFPALAEAMFPE